MQGCSSGLVYNGGERKGRKPANYPMIGIGHMDCDILVLEYYATMKNDAIEKRCEVNGGKRRLM